MSKIDKLIEILECEVKALKVKNDIFNDSQFDPDLVLKNYEWQVIRTYKEITETGDCNVCKSRKDCPYIPGPGYMVRYNCPFYVKEKEDEY